MSDSLRPHESQHAWSPCSSPTPGVHSDSCPSSPWCHPYFRMRWRRGYSLYKWHENDGRDFLLDELQSIWLSMSAPNCSLMENYRHIISLSPKTRTWKEIWVPSYQYIISSTIRNLLRETVKKVLNNPVGVRPVGHFQLDKSYFNPIAFLFTHS